MGYSRSAIVAPGIPVSLKREHSGHWDEADIPNDKIDVAFLRPYALLASCGRPITQDCATTVKLASSSSSSVAARGCFGHAYRVLSNADRRISEASRGGGRVCSSCIIWSKNFVLRGAIVNGVTGRAISLLNRKRLTGSKVRCDTVCG